ncbi:MULTISPECIES: nitrate reductase molybdenum cofactor assembly chaperone [unclassified Nocardiopsis]|uniref:nitrate reductase molybdenum cofactor assembly chaperone n=1 Tax=unclassified Nocardiopsis TaxID=2649073 RepID=UPI00135B5F14|nr:MULTISPECIES: nitrate reductase molybdenum cofactor assembly chaperone [unclassified Nocardiopsis]
MSTTTDGADARATGLLEAHRDVRRAHRLAVTRQASSVLLGRPDQVFFERLPLVARAVAELPWGPVRTGLRDFCEHAATTPEPLLREHHAEVFGPPPERPLCLAGDGAPPREELAAAYAGRTVPGGREPDHLAAVLELAARSDAGEFLLLRLRPGLDLLGEALRDRGTPYARVVDAVRASLAGDPLVPPQRTDTDAVG